MFKNFGGSGGGGVSGFEPAAPLDSVGLEETPMAQKESSMVWTILNGLEESRNPQGAR